MLPKMAYNVGAMRSSGLVALTVGIALNTNRITAVDLSTSTAITQNTCYV